MLRDRFRRVIRRVRYAPRCVRKGTDRHLYETRDGRRYWLDPRNSLDSEIIQTGEFEAQSTALVRALVRAGDVVLDVGANVGYYTVLLSKLVGPKGRVIAFEPTAKYRTIASRNLAENRIENAQLFPQGLSNREEERTIHLGSSSATLHWVNPTPSSENETIDLRRLDGLVSQLDLERLDFVKVDVDGHEPAFLEGAWTTLDRFRPMVLLEVAHFNYLMAGVDALSFYTMLKERGLYVYSERDWREYPNPQAFLLECGNTTHSANVLLSYVPLPHLPRLRR